MGRDSGCARASICILSFAMWLIGGAVLGTMMWILATTSTVKDFFTGSLVFTYVTLCVGSLLFLNGILGWISSYNRGTCLIKLYLLLSVLTISAEIGGIVSLNVMKMKMSDVLHRAWFEMNQVTRNGIQEHFDCCGFLGPEEFVETSDPIDDTCYRPMSADGQKEMFVIPSRILNRMGCKEKMVDWFYSNKYIWIGSLGSLLLLQVADALLTVYVINRVKCTQRSQSCNNIHYRTRL